MTAKKVGIEVWDLDGNGLRYAIAVDGLVRYVGAPDECVRRAEILARRADRNQRDQMLLRAVR